MKRPGFIINEIHREAWESLPDEQCGQLLKTIIAYQFDGARPSKLSPELRMAFNFLRPVVDKQKVDYQTKCEKAKEAINKRWGNTDEYGRIRPNTDDTNRRE